jgi:hypothetical protein
MGRAPTADDHLDAVSLHVHGDGNGVVQPLGIDVDMVLVSCRDRFNPIDQRPAGCKYSDSEFSGRHDGSNFDVVNELNELFQNINFTSIAFNALSRDLMSSGRDGSPARVSRKIRLIIWFGMFHDNTSS